MSKKALIKEALEKDTLVIGLKEVIKQLHAQQLSTVFLAGNCPERTKAALTQLGTLYEVPLEALTAKNTQLGVLCKKPFSISVLGIKK